MSLVLQQISADQVPNSCQETEWLRLQGITLFDPCKEVILPRLAFKYVKEMRSIMEANAGCGLAANQVGLRIPLFLFTRNDGQVLTAYKPKILVKIGDLTKSKEGCLSFPDFEAMMLRHRRIQVTFCAYPNGKFKTLDLTDQEAFTFQHELDHLKGRTIVDPYRAYYLRNLSELRSENEKADSGVR